MTLQAQQEWVRPDKPWACPDGRQVLSIDAPRIDWLMARRAMIGSSDVAKILGASKYGDAYTVWLDKTARVDFDDGTTDAMRRGQIFEEPIATLWAERYYEHPIELRRMGLVRSNVWNHAGASVDRLSICELGRCIVEIKSMSDGSDYDGDEVPLDVQFQTQWQIFNTGRDHVHVVRLGPRFTIDHRIMFRDQDVIDWMLDVLKPWWVTHVDGDEPPVPTGRAADTIRRLFGNPNVGQKIAIVDDLAAVVDRLRDLNAERAALDEQIADEEAVLRAAVGNATEVFLGSGEKVATWRPTRTIDGANQRWVKDHAELVAPYLVSKQEVDVKALVKDHPELIESGQLRYRRSWLWS